MLHQRDAIAIETSADALDKVQQAVQRALTIANLDRQSDVLRNVRAALHRIENDTFGICIHCEQEISPKRLAALPWATAHYVPESRRRARRGPDGSHRDR